MRPMLATLAVLLAAAATSRPAAACPFLQRKLSAVQDADGSQTKPHPALSGQEPPRRVLQARASKKPPPKAKRAPPRKRPSPRRRPPPRAKPPPPKRPARSPPPPPSPPPLVPEEPLLCSFEVAGQPFNYSTCYRTRDAETPLELFYAPTGDGGLAVALRSVESAAGRWMSWAIQGRFGGMYEGDAVFAHFCDSSPTGACTEVFNLGIQYSPFGFTAATPNLRLAAPAQAHALPDGRLLLQFTLDWLPQYGEELKAMFAHGPYGGTGLAAFREHEQEEPPHVKVSKAGAMTHYIL